jgi:hypothetical protein
LPFTGIGLIHRDVNGLDRWFGNLGPDTVTFNIRNDREIGNLQIAILEDYPVIIHVS